MRKILLLVAAALTAAVSLVADYGSSRYLNHDYSVYVPADPEAVASFILDPSRQAEWIRVPRFRLQQVEVVDAETGRLVYHLTHAAAEQDQPAPVAAPVESRRIDLPGRIRILFILKYPGGPRGETMLVYQFQLKPVNDLTYVNLLLSEDQKDYALAYKILQRKARLNELEPAGRATQKNLLRIIKAGAAR